MSKWACALPTNPAYLRSVAQAVPPEVTSVSPNTGSQAGGTAVNINGTGFQPGATVTFDGVAATSVVWVGSTLITCNTPAHAAGAVTVRVTNPDAQYDDLASAFTYSAGAVPVVVGVSYGVVDPAGGGERVVVEVDSSTGCTGITAGGVAFTSFAIDDGTHVSGIPGAHASGVVDVVVTNATGPSTTGTGLIEYFKPHDLSPTCELLPGSYAVAGTQGVDAVGTWTDSSGSANHAVSAGGVNAPAATSGNPVFVAANSLHLSIAKSLASAGGSPPDMATLAAGTELIFFNRTSSSGAAATWYEDATLAVGSGASAGICENDDGVLFEAYDEGAYNDYRRTAAAAITNGVKSFACGRWNGATWGCRVNGGGFNNVTNDAGVLSNGNVGAATELGRSYTGIRYFDGTEYCYLVFASALSDANVTKIYQWGRQRGIAA